jgi:acyl carrier protein
MGHLTLAQGNALGDEGRPPLRWLLLGDGAGLAARLEERLAAAGDSVRRVDRIAQPGDYGAVFAEARQADGLPQRIDRIVHLLSLDSGASADVSDTAEESGFYSLLALARALADLGPESRAGLHVGVVTSGVAAVLGDEALVPERAALLGPCRVLPQEVPGVTSTAIDLLEGDLRSSAALGRLADRLADQIIAELAQGLGKGPERHPEGEGRAGRIWEGGGFHHPDPLGRQGSPQDDVSRSAPRRTGSEGSAPVAMPHPEPLVALRGRRRFLRRFRPVELPPAERGAARLRRRGVYLITGGLDETGVTLAEQLFKACGARLALLAPEDTPPLSRWGDWLGALDERSDESRRLRRVLALERSGCDLVVAAADLAHPGQVRQAVELALARFGTIHGVVHAEGRAGAGLMQWKSRAQAASVLAPKVRGTRALAAALAGRPLDFFVLFGTNASVAGGFGQADTAAGAAFLDTFAQAEDGAREEGGQGGVPVQAPVQAIDWDFFRWQPITASTPELAAALAQGLAKNGIAERELFEVFLRVLASPLPQVVVSTQGLDVLTSQLDSFSATALLDEIGRQGAAGSHARPEISVAYEPPRGMFEETVARVWQEAFGIDRVGRDDNFFELSGNSLLAIQIVTRISQALGVDLPTASLLEAPTVAGLAWAVEKLRSGASGMSGASGETPAPEGVEEALAEADPAELERLLGEIESLSLEEAEAKLARELEAMS